MIGRLFLMGDTTILNIRGGGEHRGVKRRKKREKQKGNEKGGKRKGNYAVKFIFSNY
jgi:hypothetical protein